MQCPIVEVDGLAALLQRHRDPAVTVIGPVGPALVILLVARRRGASVAQYRRQALALHRLCRLAVGHFKRRHAGEVQQGWHHVGHMAELTPDRAKIFEFVWSRNDKTDAPSTA